MTSIDLMEYETNKDLGTISLDYIPRIGEFFINSDVIGPDWQQKFYIIRSVTYTAGGGIVLHIEHYDVEAAKKREEELKQKLAEIHENINKPVKKTRRRKTSDGSKK